MRRCAEINWHRRVIVFAVVVLAATWIPARGLAQGAANTLTAAERAAGWRLLFDGKSLDSWRGYKSETMPAGWTVVDGTFTKTAPVGDIISREQFDNFELVVDWKIGEAGNSGLFYRGTEEYDRIYWSAPEYQLLDDLKAADGKARISSAAALMALYESPAGHLKAVGEWNTARIIVNGNHVEHWLNGVKVVEAEMASADWTARVKASKFGKWPNFGLARKGHLAIQGDHAGVLAFRNLKIRPL